MVKLPAGPDAPVQVDPYAGSVFDRPSPDSAILKPGNSAWIASDSLAETSFDWRKLDVRLVPMAKR
jgi:hypothetical protein